MSLPKVLKLGIGEHAVGDGQTVISTILGSCVSVCIFSRKAGIGGMIHFALPDRTYAKSSERNDLNFGDTAIMFLYESILRSGKVKGEDLEAKVVGGGNVSHAPVTGTDIGGLNIRAARRVLHKLGIAIVGEHVGGTSGRLVYFYPQTGRLRVSSTESRTAPRITERPKAAIPKRRKKVLIVDDSRTIREILKKVLEGDDLEVVGMASNADEARPLLKELSPDVVTLDINMPGMDGVTFLEQYLPIHPVPTVMISSINAYESDLVMKALEIGAVDYLQKPTLEEISSHSDLIREKVLTAASISVRRRNSSSKGKTLYFSGRNKRNKVIAIGASTGGTEAIKEVLLKLPENIPPILIVQHIPAVFSNAFAKRLNELCPFEVIEGKDGDEVLPGRVIIAPGGLQMKVEKQGGKQIVKVYDGEKVNRHRPSVDVLFNSVASVFGERSTGIILTGMGDDGAQGLLELRKVGAYTIGQDEASCVVYGMPKAAYELGAVQKVCPLQEVAEALLHSIDEVKTA